MIAGIGRSMRIASGKRYGFLGERCRKKEKVKLVKNVP
jgi:hypothetical protein